MNRSISIIIPAYNDEQSIGNLLRDAVSVLENISVDYEIIVTDDGSSDATGEVVKKFSSSNNRVILKRHPKNYGFGVTMKEMYFGASKELVFSCPGDGQIPAKELLKMLPALEKYDIVIGRRQNRMDNWKRSIQTRFYNFLIRLMYGLKVHDVNSVKLFDKKKILEGIEFESNSPFVDAELCIKTNYREMNVGEVWIEHRRRIHDGASGGKIKIVLPTAIDLIIQYRRLMSFKKNSRKK